ncbi:hypothetical protein [Spirosoma horti]
MNNGDYAWCRGSGHAGGILQNQDGLADNITLKRDVDELDETPIVEHYVVFADEQANVWEVAYIPSILWGEPGKSITPKYIDNP